MNLLNRYIIKKILSKYLFLLVGFLILFLIVDIIENIDKFSDSEISTTKIFYYYIYSIPWFISIALPMTTLLSCIFTIGQLQKHHELTALKASGISLKKLSIIFILLGIIISASSFLFDNTLVSSSTKKRTEITKKYLSNKSKSQQIKKFHLVNNSNGLENILYISNYDFIKRHAKNVTITELDKNNNLIATYTVDTLAWNDRQSSWNCKNVKKRKANNNFQAEFISEQEKIRQQLQQMQEKLSGQPEGEKIGDNLNEILEEMEKNEVDLVNKRLTQQLVERQKKIVTKMLEAEESIREQKIDPEREGETADKYTRQWPPAYEEYLKARKSEIELLKSVPIELNPFYKKEVNDYFRRLSEEEIQ